MILVSLVTNLTIQPLLVLSLATRPKDPVTLVITEMPNSSANCAKVVANTAPKLMTVKSARKVCHGKPKLVNLVNSYVTMYVLMVKTVSGNVTMVLVLLTKLLLLVLKVGNTTVSH